MKIKKILILIIPLVFESLCIENSHSSSGISQYTGPKLTLIIVIDQFSAHYINQLKPYLRGGLKFLIGNGINYLNAFYPHALPSTGPGHTMLSTGTYGNYHGIINNKWFDSQGQTIKCDQDSPDYSAVFAPDGRLYDYGKSARNIMVDNLSDQLMMYSYPHANNNVWSIGIKSRASICTAGRLGKAIWRDDDSQFTSSIAYFDQLPEWVKAFNSNLKKDISQTDFLLWKSLHPIYSDAYNFKNINDYTASRMAYSVINKRIHLDSIKDINGNLLDKRLFNKVYTRIPMSIEHVCQLAKSCIDNNLGDKKEDRLVLWLCIANLDKIGHIFGPNSKEAIDTIYHIDNKLDNLFNYIFGKVDPSDVLFVLTADHGIQPITKLVQKTGLDFAHIYQASDLVKDMNNLIYKKYGIEKIIQNFNKPQFYLDQYILKSLNPETKRDIYLDLKKYLEKLPGIAKVWTFDELENQIFEPNDPDLNFKRQLFKGRSGQIIYSVRPYTLIDDTVFGTSHGNQYTYNTHVPLIIYQKNRFQNKIILDNVYMYQLPITLANILGVPRPSAAFGSVLPL